MGDHPDENTLIRDHLKRPPWSQATLIGDHPNETTPYHAYDRPPWWQSGHHGERQLLFKTIFFFLNAFYSMFLTRQPPLALPLLLDLQGGLKWGSTALKLLIHEHWHARALILVYTNSWWCLTFKTSTCEVRLKNNNMYSNLSGVLWWVEHIIVRRTSPIFLQNRKAQTTEVVKNLWNTTPMLRCMTSHTTN